MNRYLLAAAVPALVAPAVAEANHPHLERRLAAVRADYHRRDHLLRERHDRTIDRLQHELRHALRDRDHHCVRRLHGEIAAEERDYARARADLRAWLAAETRRIEHECVHVPPVRPVPVPVAPYPASGGVGFSLRIGGLTVGTIPNYQVAPPVYQSAPPVYRPQVPPPPAHDHHRDGAFAPGFFRPDYSTRRN